MRLSVMQWKVFWLVSTWNEQRQAGLRTPRYCHLSYCTVSAKPVCTRYRVYSTVVAIFLYVAFHKPKCIILMIHYFHLYKRNRVQWTVYRVQGTVNNVQGTGYLHLHTVTCSRQVPHSVANSQAGVTTTYILGAAFISCLTRAATCKQWAMPSPSQCTVSCFLQAMNGDQLSTEKQTLQKYLLHFEAQFGRPVSATVFLELLHTR